MAASAAVSVIARSWRGHRSECRGSSRPSQNNGSVPEVRTTTKSRKASTLPPLSGIPVMQDDRRSRSTTFGSRIKDFFRSTVRRQLRVSSSLSPSRGGDNFSGTKLRSKSQSPAAKAESKRIKPPTSQKSGTRHSASSVSYGTQNGYSCSCSIEVLQESPRAGTRRTLHYNGIASSYNSVEVDSLYSRTERHDGDGQTEESSQGATDSLCDPWEQSTSSTCTSTSSPRLRTSSCASQCSRLAQEEDRVKPHRRRAFSSSSNHSSRVEETEHTGHHRPRSNSSRLPTPRSSRVGVTGEAVCFAPTSPSQSAATSLNSTSTQNSRGIHIRNFRSRLPKRKNHTSQAEASSQPTSPTRNSKAFWPVKYRNKVRKEVMRLIIYSLAWLGYSGYLMARETAAWLFSVIFFLKRTVHILSGFTLFITSSSWHFVCTVYWVFYIVPCYVWTWYNWKEGRVSYGWVRSKAPQEGGNSL